MAGTFELKKASNGQFHFNLKAGNAEIILKSEMYDAKASAQGGIAAVQKNCQDESRYAKADASNGQFHFTLKAANHQVIGTSQMYATAATRDAGIESVRTNGVTTNIKDDS